MPKTDSELGDAIVKLMTSKMETYVFHNEVAMGISKPEDIVAIYGEPRLVYIDETTAKEGYTWLVYRYRYGHYTDNLDEQIYIEFAFKRENDNKLGTVLAGGKTCLLEEDEKRGVVGDEWR
ncbi:MAG TPA: hypothetical protein DEO82_04460 [Eubacterium sp.]|nr:hypothetical protein [Eubacterium sp.]